MSDVIPTIVEELHDEIERLKSTPTEPDTILPVLKVNEIFFCTYCGNDEVKPEQYKLDYSTVEDPLGNTLYKKSLMDYKSNCCGEYFIILNTETQEEVPWPDHE